MASAKKLEMGESARLKEPIKTADLIKKSAHQRALNQTASEIQIWHLSVAFITSKIQDTVFQAMTSSL